MDITGKVSMYINIAMAVVGALATATPAVFPSFIPSQITSDVIQCCGFISFIGGIVNAALHAAGGQGVSK